MEENIEIIRKVNKLLIIEDLDEKEINDILSDDVIIYIITKTNAKTFEKIMNILNYPDKLIQQRKDIENDLLNDINNVNKSYVQDLISQIYFKDYAKNTLLNIETIIETINSKKDLKEMINDNILKLLNNLKYFFSLNINELNNYDLNNLILILNELRSQNKLYIIDKLFSLVQKSFYLEMKNSFNKSKILNGINYEEINLNGRCAKYYKLQCQTENQKQFYLLTRTNKIEDYMLKDNAKKEYIKAFENKKYLSYSLIDNHIYDSFSSKDRIIFGYDDIKNNYIMSSNTHDGQTNQYALKDNFYVIKQQYLSLKDFLIKTDKYNEIVLKNDIPILPSYIISNTEIPSRKILEVSINMNIPIIYLDPNYYDIHIPVNPVSNEERNTNWYNHFNYLEYDLLKLCNFKKNNIK